MFLIVWKTHADMGEHAKSTQMFPTKEWNPGNSANHYATRAPKEININIVCSLLSYL